MKKILFVLLLSCIFGAPQAQAQGKKKKRKKDYVFTLTTEMGEMKFVLFDETPIHKANFLAKVEAGFYDSTTFHRVIDNFMIQGGDPNTRPGAKVDNGRPQPPNEENSLEAEILPNLKHDKGMIAAARLGDRINPKKRSSLSQFYIVQNENGTPHLNGGYTVFGTVIQGMDLVDEIAGVKTSRPGDRPLKPIYMTISVKKMSKKKIKKLYGYSFDEAETKS